MTQEHSATGKIIGAIVVIVVVAVAAWWYFSYRPSLDLSAKGPAPSGPAVASTAPPRIEHPISEAQTGPAPASTVPLPALAESDSAVVSALASLPGASGLANLLVAQGLIPHLVATVDALPRNEIGSSILPLRTPAGTFTVQTIDGQPAIAADNYTRYAPYMAIIENTDPHTLVTWYVQWYPLFQQAYQQLGFPQGYFNDRLLAAIDNMLAAPNVQSPPALVKTADGHYAFADPTWEALSVGQKLMIRIGPENERAVKNKLRSIRALLLGQGPELHAPAAPPQPAATVPATSG